MKRKLLFLATFVVSMLGAKAQTDVFKDVTADYLTNADFEGEYTVYTYPTNSGSGKRAIYTPTGWTVSSYQSGHVNDMTALDANSLRWNNEFNGKTPSYTGHDLGGKTYWIRYNSGSGQILRLSQETRSALPKSKYRLTVDWYVSNTSTGSGYIRIDDDQSVKSETGWATTSKDFTSTGKKYTFTLGAFHGNTSNTERIYAFDNFKLEWNLTQSLADLIDEANTFYDDHSSYSILKTAIDAADEAKESSDADVLETQYNALSSALALAQAQAAWQAVHDVLAGKGLTVLPTAAANAITTELDKAVPTTTADAVNEAKDALQALIDSYDGIKTAYAKVKALITLATSEKNNSAGDADAKSTLEDAITAATTNIENRTNATELGTDYTTLESARQSYVTSGAEPTEGHPFDWTFKLSNPSFESGTTGWTLNKSTTDDWTYEAESYTPAPVDGKRCLNAWGKQIDFIEVYQNVTLPMGSYSFKGYLYSTGKKAQHIYAPGNNDSSNLSTSDSWEQLSINFTQSSSSDTSIKMGIYSAGNNVSGNSYGWFRADHFQLFYYGKKPVLNDAITSVNGVTTSAINVGDGAFQIPTSAKTTLEGAVSTAQGVYNNTAAYGNTITEAISTLNTAVGDFWDSELNTPANDARYRIKSTAATGAGWKDKYYMLRPDDSQANGGYSTKADVDNAAHLAIAWKFTAVTGGYTLSMTDADGATRYLCTNIKGYGQGSATQIRTTTDSEKALVVKVIAATGTDGRWYLQNTEDNSYLGGQDAGLYSNSQNYDLALEEATKASATLKITGAKWGTFIVPFTAEIPDGVTAYTATSDGTSITLSDPITDSFAANTPYIVYSESPITKDDYEGWGTATQDSYTFGQLTGTYTRIFAPKDSYILQNNDNKVGFYLCDVADTYVVAKNRCYLTPSSSSNPVKAFILGDFADDIQTILSGNNDETKSDIYDLTGRKVNKVTKGIYIINGKKVMMK